MLRRHRRLIAIVSRSLISGKNCSTVFGFQPTVLQKSNQIGKFPPLNAFEKNFCGIANNSFHFDKESEETLESLGEKFEELLEDDPRMSEADVSLSNGVLTIVIPDHGTYVINKQSPNKQIWLSSPLSGPYRFDHSEGKWIYSHTGESLHALLNREVGEKILGVDAKFDECYLGGGQ